jgi:proteasome lid subunit RPN8/RPN11
MTALPNRREIVPLSPAFPEAWTHDIAEAAYTHAIEAYPKEAAGVVEGDAYVPLDNLSVTPGDDVMLSDDDLVRVAKAEVFFHSHPSGHGCPSQHDMIYQQQLGIPFVTMTVPLYDVWAFGDQLARAPIIGRGFRHGVHDCYSLIRDWYAEAGVELPEGPRGWEWWSKGQDLYRDNFERAGFDRIAPAEAVRRGDLLLFSFNYNVPMHGAIVIDEQLLLHHAAGARAVDATRLSTMVPRTRLARHATMALRHQSFPAP